MTPASWAWFGGLMFLAFALFLWALLAGRNNKP